jgi:valyl-tRNA synthetase
MEEVLRRSIHDIDLNFKKFRISEALMITYKLFWDEFSGWYLEIIKPSYQKPVDRVTVNATIAIFDKLLKLIHPFMPFITEDLWQNLGKRQDGESIMVSLMPEARKYNKDLVSDFEAVKETVSAVRSLRKEKSIPVREKLELLIRDGKGSLNTELLPVITRLCNLSHISFVSEKPAGAISFMVNTTEYFIPLSGSIDVGSELKKLNEELAYNKGFLVTIMKKLDNQRFVQNAPASVLELERKKRSDTESKIKSIEERIKEFGK